MTSLRCSGAYPINSTSIRCCSNSNKHNLNFNNSFNLSWPFTDNIAFVIPLRISKTIYVRINNENHNYTNNLKLVIEWKLNGQSTLYFYNFFYTLAALAIFPHRSIRFLIRLCQFHLPFYEDFQFLAQCIVKLVLYPVALFDLQIFLVELY